MIDSIKYRGFDINIHQDIDAIDPREEFDSMGKMICWHNNYSLGDKNIYQKPIDFLVGLLSEIPEETVVKLILSLDGIPKEDREEIQEDYESYLDYNIEDSIEDRTQILTWLSDYYIILPLFLMDHSGISMSTGNGAFQSCDPQGWDWGQVGFIYISNEKAMNEYPNDPEWKQKAIKYLKGEVQTYDYFISGAVYGYQIEATDRNKRIICDDSCWGYYGYDHNESGLLDCAKERIDYAITEYRESVKQEKKREKDMTRFMSFAWAY